MCNCYIEQRNGIVITFLVSRLRFKRETAEIRVLLQFIVQNLELQRTINNNKKSRLISNYATSIVFYLFRSWYGFCYCLFILYYCIRYCIRSYWVLTGFRAGCSHANKQLNDSIAINCCFYYQVFRLFAFNPVPGA